MPSFLMKKMGEFEEHLESVEEAVERVIQNSNQNFDVVKNLFYGNLDYVNFMDRGITTEKVAAEAITAYEIEANTITANEIAAGTITAVEIAAGSITAYEIAANTITANEIEAGTITAGEIAAGTITGNEIAANTITALEISVLELSALSANLGTITAGSISGVTGTFSGSLSAQDVIITDSSQYETGSLNMRVQDDYFSFKGAFTPNSNFELGLAGTPGGSLSNISQLWIRAWDTLFTGNVTIDGGISGIKTANDTHNHGNTGSTSVAAHNHGIADGTKLATSGGGEVTFVAYGGHNHNHSTSNDTHDHGIQGT